MHVPQLALPTTALRQYDSSPLAALADSRVIIRAGEQYVGRALRLQLGILDSARDALVEERVDRNQAAPNCELAHQRAQLSHRERS